MKKKAANTKIGLLVTAGLVFLILTLYMIGKNRNLLGATFTIRAVVVSVNGLVPGNNVRYKGIDVGTVKSISVENDTAIIVTMVVDRSFKPFIRKNAIASIGTDGLMGNKLININSVPGISSPIEENDIIQARKPVETEEMLRTLNTANTNIERITSNLYDITAKLNSSQSLWTLLSDTIITADLRNAVADFRRAGANTSAVTRSAQTIIREFEQGDGVARRIFTDTSFSKELSRSVTQIHNASARTALLMNDLQKVIEGMKAGDGAVGLILSDSALRQKLFNSASSIEQGTEKFNVNMEALRENFFFRKYFRKLEKRKPNRCDRP